jgi:putative transposase
MVSAMKNRGLSTCRSCALIGISRSSYSYQPSPEKQQRDKLLGQQLHAIAAYHKCYGYRPAHRELLEQGETVNHKRVQRVWRLEGLSLPLRRTYRKIRTGASVPLAATRPNEVWSYDFIHDKCNRGHRLKFLTITDEFTRRSLAIVTGTSITASRVRAELEKLFVHHGAPECIRSDNGPEFVSKSIRGWLNEQGVETIYIAPGCPWQNAYAESFHSRFRAECLDRQWFHTVREAAVVVEAWRKYYNQERLHSSLDYMPPEVFEKRWHSAKLQTSHNTANLPN